MDESNLRRVFDQISPSPEQKAAMLNRLLREERKATPMQNIKKIPTVLVAASLLLLACAFTVMTGLDERLLVLFCREPEDQSLIINEVVQTNQSHTYANGWTVEIGQALVDRYSLAVLVDLTAPEDTVLDGDDYYIVFNSKLIPELNVEGQIGSFVSGSRFLSDDDPTDNHISFLWYRGPTSYLEATTQEFIGNDISLQPLWTGENCTNGTIVDFSEETYTYFIELPEQDSGASYQTASILSVGEQQIDIKDIYLSPISFALQLTGEDYGLDFWASSDWIDFQENIFLNMTDGSKISMGRAISQTYNPDEKMGEFVFQTAQIIDPTLVTSVTLFNQTFPLEHPAPSETDGFNSWLQSCQNAVQ